METKENSPDLPKKCFCARCFLPIDADDKVDIEGQNFHKICSMCCICRNVPKSLKTFYGHVFCTECFKTHVLSRFRGEQKCQSNSWWTPMTGERVRKTSDTEEIKAVARTEDVPEEPKDLKDDSSKKQICARCLETIPQDMQVTIGGQAFHQPCARCYCCHSVPTNSVKIYYGQVFCEECFNRFVINRDKDNPSEFYKSCFENWNNSPQFAEHMRDFMTSGKSSTSPMVFMMQGQQQPFCRCSGSETQQPSEAKKCKTNAEGEPGWQRAEQSLARGDAQSPPPRIGGPLQRDWREGPPRRGSATLQHDTGLTAWRESSLQNELPNQGDSVFPPRQKKLQRHYNEGDAGVLRLDDVAQRFVSAVRHQDNILMLDDSESRDSGRDCESESQRDADSLAHDNSSARSKESQSPMRHDDSLYFYNESAQCGTMSPSHGHSKDHRNPETDCGKSSPRRENRSSKHGNRSPRHGNGSPKRGNRSPRHGNGSPLRGNGSPKRGNGSPHHGTRSPRLDCFPLRHENCSPHRKRSRHDKDPLWRDNCSLISENESLRNENVSLKSDNGFLQHEIGSLGQDDGSVQHQTVSAVSSMLPLFQSSLESSRTSSPRRRFLRHHEKKMFAATSVHTGEDFDSWDLLSIRTEITGTETNEDLCSVGNESANLGEIVDAAEREKIEKLTQYLQRASQKNRNKNWKMFYDTNKTALEYESKKAASERGDEPAWRKEPAVSGWVDIQLRRKKNALKCPRCLWQSGIFTANSGLVSKLLMSSGSSFFE